MFRTPKLLFITVLCGVTGFSPLPVQADHEGPERIVEQKYVILLSLTPNEAEMRLRFFFKDIETGEAIRSPITCLLRISEDKSDSTILSNARLEVTHGAGEMIYAFPKSGLYDVSLQFQKQDEPGKIYHPRPWPVWVPGKETEQKHTLGLSEIVGFSLAGLAVMILIINIWWKPKLKI